MQTQSSLPEKVLRAFIEGTNNAYDAVYLYGDAISIEPLVANAVIEIQRQKPHQRIIHTSGDLFTHSVISSIIQGSAHEVQSSHRADILILEGIQAVANSLATQQELYSLIDWYLENKKQILVTGNAPITAIDGLEPRIQAQLSGALSVTVITKRLKNTY